MPVEELWDDSTIEAVWSKGEEVTSYDSTKYRKDSCGAWISRVKHGDRDSILGWEIDHVKPKSKGGTDDLSNLRPLQWENNLSTSNEEQLVCVVTSEGNKNVHK